MEKDTLTPEKMNIKTYVAAGAINIENIAHVENLFPGSPDLISSVLAKHKSANAPSQTSQDSTKLSLTERLIEAIRQLVDEKEIQSKQEFAALYQITNESILEGVKKAEFVRLVCGDIEMDESIRPSEDNLKKVVFHANRFPDWRIDGLDYDKTLRFVRLARKLLDKMNGHSVP